MPKGSVPRKPAVVKNVKTWAGDVIKPDRTVAQLNARAKNMGRDFFPTTAQRREAKARKDVYSDEAVSSPAMRKMRENPYAALKRKAAARTTKTRKK